LHRWILYVLNIQNKSPFGFSFLLEVKINKVPALTIHLHKKRPPIQFPKSAAMLHVEEEKTRVRSLKTHKSIRGWWSFQNYRPRWLLNCCLGLWGDKKISDHFARGLDKQTFHFKCLI
jgi:hypothetical protein